MRAGEPPVDIRSLRTDREDLSGWIALLADDEIARADRFRLVADRARFILGRGLLRRMLGDAAGRDPSSFRFGSDANGKPTLADTGDIAFNVSHSGAIVMAAVGRVQAVGIDVEQHRGDIDVLALGRHVLTPTERAVIAAAPVGRTALFFRQWVFKEALVKGLGTGLSREPRRFEILFNGDTPRVHFVGDGEPDIGAGWQLRPLGVEPGYSAALAVLPFI